MSSQGPPGSSPAKQQNAPRERGAQGADLGEGQHGNDSTEGTLLGQHLLLRAACIDKQLSACDHAVLAVLLEHYNRKEGVARPGQQRIATLVGRRRASVFESIKRLEAAGYIQVIRNATKTCRYAFKWRAPCTPEQTSEYLPTCTPDRTSDPGHLVRSAVETCTVEASKHVRSTVPEPASNHLNQPAFRRGQRLSAVERVLANVEDAECRDELARSKDGDVIEGEFTREMQPAQTSRATSKSPEEKYRDQVAWINQQAHLGAITKEERLRQLQELKTSLGGGHGQ